MNPPLDQSMVLRPWIWRCGIAATRILALLAALLVLPVAAQPPGDTETATPNQTSPNQTSPNQTSPEQTSPEQTSPEQTDPEPPIGVDGDAGVGGDTTEASSDSKPEEINADPGVTARPPSSQESFRRPMLRLPPTLPDGRPLRPIALFLSQMDELIPDDYRPVSIDQLNDAISRLTDRATDDRASLLKNAVYWVTVKDGVLVSDRSVIEIESDRPTEVRRSLGKVNLAMEPPQGRSSESLQRIVPRLESEPDGNLVAVFRGDAAGGASIEFQWKLHGQLSGTGHEYVMQLPRTPQTLIVLSAPDTMIVEALDGVLRRRSGPPDAVELASDRNLQWYEIDAGGLSQVRLRTRQQRAETERSKFILRRSSIQYEVDTGGLSWTSRMVLQLPSDTQLPPMQVSGTTVTSVKVNASDIPFSSELVDDRVLRLQFELPSGQSIAEATSVNLTVTGYSTWLEELGWCDLPRPAFVGSGLVQASAVDEVQLAVFDPLRLMAWQLPSGWKQLQDQRLENGVTLFSADGPPMASEASSSTPATPTPWSRVRLSRVPDLMASDTTLRLEVGPGVLTAKAALAVTLDPSRVEPIRVEVEPNWSLESVTFAYSGRVVEDTGLSEPSRILELWPEAEDAEGGRIVIEVTGTRAIASAAGGLMVPATWFARVADVRGRMLAAVIPPTDLNWSGEAAMERHRITAPALTVEQQRFFGVLSPDTLWFQPESGRMPSVLLQTPSVSYNVSSVLDLALEDGDLVERLMIAVEAQSQSLKQLIIHTGPSQGRPDFAWAIRGTDDGPAINLPSSDVIVGQGDEDGVYTIDLSDIGLRGRSLIARRRYPLKREFELQLPSVPGAASQDSDVLVDPGLVIRSHPRSVQLVPLSPEDWLRFHAAEKGIGDRTDAIADSPAGVSGSGRGWTRLRYDAVEQPTIDLVRLDSNPDVTIVWRERIRVIASSRGTDRIEATYTVSPSAPLAIYYDDDLQLASIHRDGEPVDLNTLQQRPIVLQPRFRTEVIQVVWDRIQFGHSWIRRCRIPEIRVSATVLRSEIYLNAASDSFTPAALLAGDSDGGIAIKVRSGDSTILVRRNTALAIGWMFAILVFAFAWNTAERAPMTIASLLVLALGVLFLWWPWRQAIIGWLIVPILAAAMLSTSRAWGRSRRELDDRTSEEQDGMQSASGIDDSLGGFSVRTMTRSMVLWLFVMFGSGVASHAQESRPATTVDPASAINVLVPVLETGQLSGDMVYIPRNVFSELFRSGDSRMPKEARFQSASYRVRINPSVSNGEQLIFTSVEAEYLIHIADGDESVNSVRLPLGAANVRRLETIDEPSRIIPFEPDVMGQVIASLPRGNTFRLRATFRPSVTQSQQWTRLSLSIPPVASSRLSVESEQNVDAIRFGGSTGRLLMEEAELLRRWVEDIGPTRSLEIDVRVGGDGPGETSRALGRRYWIHAGKDQATIDCEVDPPNSLAAGETFQFVVRDSLMPDMVSSTWRFKGSELYSPTRRLITVESTQDAPGPIRLLWTQPLRFGGDDLEPTASIRIPEVIAAALGENSDAWLAWHCDTSLQFAPIVRETIEPLSVDQFLAAWIGYRGRIDRAFVAIGEIPSPVLQVKPASSPIVEQSHHLHVMPDNLELFYSATLTPSDSNRKLYQLRVPESLELTRVSVNGIELIDQPRVSDGFRELLLGDFVGTEAIKIEAMAIAPIRPRERFAPPRLTILPDTFTIDSYSISRDRAVTLRVVKKPTAEPRTSNDFAMAESLARGWIPVSSWDSRSENSPSAAELPGGQFEVQAKPTRFDCDQLIVLNRLESQWSMETHVKFDRRIPDYVDIEVPTSWCDRLEVYPVTALTRQPATDPTRQVIRILCDPSVLRNETLSIRGQLVATEMGRIGVPSIRVLGIGQRRIHVSVPNQLDGEPVQWRTSAVEGDQLPSQWIDAVGSVRRSTYVVANPSWSIELAPLSEVDAEAVALAMDAQSFPREDGVLMMCHWDLFPGSLEKVEVRLPEQSQCLAVWSAGKSVVPETEADLVDDGTKTSRLKIPLALSRLSQPLELLIHVPSASAREPGYLPELVGIPVKENWLTSYVPSDTQQSVWGETTPPSLDRSLSLAEAVLNSMDAVGSLSQRPRDEVETWLRLWIARYRIIAESVGHQVDLGSDIDGELTTQTLLSKSDQSQDQDKLALPSHLQWEQLDARMNSFVRTFFTDDGAGLPAELGPEIFLFGVGKFEGFLPGRISKPDPSDPPRAVRPVLQRDQGLRSLIVGVLTLTLIGGLLICLRPLRDIAAPLVKHPAFWLGLMGVFGFGVAPLPVAAALVLVAVALPVFPSRRRPTPNAVR